jgi:hypothetical protein
MWGSIVALHGRYPHALAHLKDGWWEDAAHVEVLRALVVWRDWIDQAAEDPRHELAFHAQLSDYSRELRQEGGGVTRDGRIRLQNGPCGGEALDEPVGLSVVDLPSAVSVTDRLLDIRLRQTSLVKPKQRVVGPDETLDGHRRESTCRRNQYGPWSERQLSGPVRS